MFVLGSDRGARALPSIVLAGEHYNMIRVGIWGGEEEGLLGSKAYVKQHFDGDANKAARDDTFVYLNMDPAPSPIYGWHMQDSEPANADLYERVGETDLKQNATVMAWFAWQAANSDQPIPRPAPAPTSGR